MKNFPEEKIAQNCSRGPQTQSEFFRSREGRKFCRLYNQSHDLYLRRRGGGNGWKKALETLIECDKMGKRTKADKARIQNLNIQRKSEKSRVEDVTDSEDEEYLPEDREDLFLCVFCCVLISSYQICKQISSIYQCVLTGSVGSCHSGKVAWANRKYHSHRCLPPYILADLRKEYHML